MELLLEGRTAIVTGASAGIGREIARQLVREGVHVVAVARRADLLQDLAHDLDRNGRSRLTLFPGDVTDPSLMEKLRGSLRQTAQHVDIVVNSAGGSRPIELLAPESVWSEAHELNFVAVRRTTLAFVAEMMAHNWGRVINITGTLEPLTLTASNAAKAAVHAWAKALSRHVAPRRVTVNSIVPGRIMTEQMRERLFPNDAERERFARENIPLGHFGEPKDVAALATFLCSELARYVTGNVFHVDGGMHRFAY